MQVDAGNTITMRLQYTFHRRLVRNICRAFIMNDYIITGGIVRLAKDGQWRLGTTVTGVNLIYYYIGARFNAFLQDVLLLVVIMTASACNQEHPKRLRRVSRR